MDNQVYEMTPMLKCDVYNCTYNDQQKNCTATEVKVCNNGSAQNTKCDTYEASN